MTSRPEARRALLRAGDIPSEDELQQFYAQRVSDYAGVLFAVFAGMYGLGLFLALVLMPERAFSVHLHPAKLANLVFALLAFVIWRRVGRQSTAPWLVLAADVALPACIGGAVLWVAFAAPPGNGLYFAPFLIGALILVLRAALVPSAPLRTVLVGLSMAVPVAASAYLMARADPSLPPAMTAGLVGGGSALWGTALVGATALVSRTVYGLQKDVQKARRLGQYVLGDLIGEGGMGSVYRAQHAMLRRPTAVKVLLPERAGRDSIARFEREVRLTARLTHPNTVAVYDYGSTPDGRFYYAMELLEGLSLEELVKRYGPQPPGRVIHILQQMAGALAEAHSLGLIHRDVKPANILFCERGGVPDTVKLLDFGLVKSVEPEPGPALTQANAITGTPQYIAPETITAPLDVDHRVDVYALGGVGYALLTGRPPFEGESLLVLAGHHLHTAPVPPSEVIGRTLPDDLERLVLECLAKHREQRPQTAAELVERLVQCAERTPWATADARAWWAAFRASEAAASP
jgi:eukaryotic-like serine/threonine-protein kinase